MIVVTMTLACYTASIDTTCIVCTAAILYLLVHPVLYVSLLYYIYILVHPVLYVLLLYCMYLSTKLYILYCIYCCCIVFIDTICIVSTATINCIYWYNLYCIYCWVRKSWHIKISTPPPMTVKQVQPALPVWWHSCTQKYSQIQNICI